MRARQLLQLCCPFCHHRFTHLDGSLYWPASQHVRFGILRCECDRFPIIEGIVVLRRGLHVCTEEIVRAKQEQRIPEALIFLQELSELRLVPRRVFEILVRLTATIRTLSPIWMNKNGAWWWRFGLWCLSTSTSNQFLKNVFRYFRQRDRRPTYILVASIMRQLGQFKSIVEVGGGAGHLVRSLATSGWTGTIYTIEKNFWLFYWLACCGQWTTNTCPIIADVESLLPFKSATADVVLANDTLMYVDHQRYLATEIARICKKNGVFFGMHIHQAGRQNIANGIGMRPAQLRQWLGMKYVTALGDSELFTQLWQQGQVEMKTTQKSLRVAAHSASFSMIASRKPTTITLALQSRYQKHQLDYVEDAW